MAQVVEMNIPDNLKYSKEHEWLLVEDGIATIGITDYAQDQLGDIVYVEVDTVGETIAKDEVFGSVEAVKAVSDLYMPIGGEILELNEDLEDAPESVNEDAFGKGWIIKVKVADPAELESLLDAKQYEDLIG